MSNEMLPMQSYLVRALYDWIVDSRSTPYLLVNAEMPEVCVPKRFIKDGQIVLNVERSAVKDLIIDAEAVSFTASFDGIRQSIYVPILAVKAIYAMENGQGMVFETDDQVQPNGKTDSSSSGSSSASSGKKGRHLHVVK
ncbi:MAG: ClpXP protease specificity-enhancing factor [Pseudomonadota bacterium]